MKYVMFVQHTLAQLFLVKSCHPLMMYILLLVSSPEARGLICLCSDLNPQKVRVLLRSASAKHAVLSYGWLRNVSNGNSAFGLNWTHEFSHQTREHGNIVGTDKPGRVVVIRGGWFLRSVKV